MTNAERNKRLTKARVALLLDHPFFGTLATQLKTEFSDAVPTACTNGERIVWGTDFFDALPDAHLRGVLAHEVMHVALGHTWRRGGRDPQAWNIAADLAINSVLRDAGLPLPEGALYPTAGNEGKAAEHYYSAPPAGQNGKGQGNGNDPAGCGGVEDAPGGNEGAKAQEAKWRVAVAQAASAAKAHGKLPGDLARLVEEIVAPRLPWYVLLRDFVERAARNDYNWAQPNRRYLGRGIILPSLVSEELPAIVLVVDTSGSIGAPELARFAAEASGVLGAYETTIHVLDCDADVNAHTEYTRADLPLRLTNRGGRGTDFRPPFAWVTERGLQPACLIYLTDGCGPFPDAEPDYPVLWVMTTDRVAPWGQTVQM